MGFFWCGVWLVRVGLCVHAEAFSDNSQVGSIYFKHVPLAPSQVKNSQLKFEGCGACARQRAARRRAGSAAAGCDAAEPGY